MELRWGYYPVINGEFSGGKDSQVLLHIARSMFPNIPAVFCDTGLEYPEIRKHVQTFENVVWMKPGAFNRWLLWLLKKKLFLLRFRRFLPPF